MARYLAKNIVANGLCKEAKIQLSYAIGVEQPTSVRLITPSNDKHSDWKLAKKLFESVDLSPAGIIRQFDLRRPIYASTAAGGHFGRDEFPWERLDLNLNF